MSFRVNVLIKDDNGEGKLIYNLLSNKAKAVDEALKIAFKNPKWREKYLIKIPNDKLKEMFETISQEN
jgi:hypothetical protein